MEREQFAQAVFWKLVAHGVTDVEYLADKFSFRRSDGWVSYLGNVYQECCRVSDQEREARIAQFVASMISTHSVPRHWAAASPLLRPVLRPVTRGMGESIPNAQMLARPAFPFVDEAVVVDMPFNRAFVSSDMAREWDVEPALVFDTARANLNRLTQEGRLRDREIIQFRDTGDSYFGSCLLVPGWLAGYSTGGHRPVAFIPDNDTLLVVPDDPALLEQVFEMVEQQYIDAVRPISPQGYTIDEAGRVVPFDQIGAHPARPLALRARCGLAVTEYAIQTRILTDKFDSDLDILPWSDVDPAYVAAVKFETSPEGPITTTVWGEGVEYLLPQTDYVHFVRGDTVEDIELICTVPFDVVVELMGLIPLPGLSPTRFEARHWPDETTLNRLRNASKQAGQ
ncbi:hypothetical protein [Nocardia bhagyanarayanae]|uniref:Uncharacterized protein n=1 Tax=Nocardia bhagyanarayanae TaxID=1215925 RepID=A0A543FGS8_9NOCA|nr:hypothetical protein [Nocardia bhagyanarayanae]TQM32966.1 hypothetical protein FB390_4673 [Nocardia bhagyanarayanae]